MLSAFHTLRFKYSVAFLGMAMAILVVLVADSLLIGTTKERMVLFGETFNGATSLIINADRDLYQAQLATLQYLQEAPGSEAAETFRNDFRENARQAHDRVEAFFETLAPYAVIEVDRDTLERHFDAWQQAARQAFERHDDSDAGAIDFYRRTTSPAFEELRTLYDVATQAPKERIVELEAATLEHIETQHFWTTGFALAVFLAAVILALTGPRLLSRAIRRVTDRIQEITEGDGDLTARVRAVRQDEVGDLARAFNTFIGRIDRTLQEVQQSSRSVRFAADEIASGSRDLSSRAEQAASSLQQTSASMDEITATVQNTSESASQASELALATEEVSRRGLSAMQEVSSSMQRISESASRIKEVVTLIDSIAFQTNLLALNASVEAARAGEHGRGFAVVASEVRQLAGRAGEASKEIRTLVEDSVANTHDGAGQVDKARGTMEEVMASIERMAGVVGEISTSASEQTQGIGQVNTAVGELDTMTQQNVAMVEQTHSAAEEMRRQSQRLAELLGGFKLGDEEAGWQYLSSGAGSTASDPEKAPLALAA